MHSIFNDQSLEEQLKRDGYITVPFLNKEEVLELNSFFNQQQKHFDKGLHVTMFVDSYDYRKAIDQKIKEIFQQATDKYLDKYRPLYGNFMVKEPGPESDFPIHQDWTYVDEDQFRSIAIWVPLIDVDETNGALQVIHGSHDIIRTLRGVGLKSPYEDLYEVIREKYLKTIPMKAGEAIMWDHSLVHASAPNTTSQTRLAATTITVPQEAEVYHYFRDQNKPLEEVEKFKVDTDFYMNYKIGERPVGVESLGIVHTDIRSLGEDEIKVTGI